MNRLLDQTFSVLPKPTATFLFRVRTYGSGTWRAGDRVGEQVTGLEIPPVGDAWSVPRKLVRRLDELYQFYS